MPVNARDRRFAKLAALDGRALLGDAPHQGNSGKISCDSFVTHFERGLIIQQFPAAPISTKNTANEHIYNYLCGSALGFIHFAGRIHSCCILPIQRMACCRKQREYTPYRLTGLWHDPS